MVGRLVTNCLAHMSSAKGVGEVCVLSGIWKRQLGSLGVHLNLNGVGHGRWGLEASGVAQVLHTTGAGQAHRQAQLRITTNAWCR